MNATRSPLEGQERCPPPGPARSSHPTPTGDVDPTPAAEPGATRALHVDVHAGGILKRVDGGTGWSVAAATMRGWSVLSLALDPASPRFVYAGTWSGGVWKSTDAGADGQTAVMGLAIDLQKPRNVYAAVDSGFNGGVHCSADGGAMWTCSTGGPPHNFRLHALGVAQRTEQLHLQRELVVDREGGFRRLWGIWGDSPNRGTTVVGRKNAAGRPPSDSEPPRVFRRLPSLSQAANANSFC